MVLGIDPEHAAAQHAAQDHDGDEPLELRHRGLPPGLSATPGSIKPRAAPWDHLPG
jgi:hypothetical protein